MSLSLSLLVSKNLKLKKVIKSFVPEPISSVFELLYFYEHLWTFSVSVMNMSVSRVRILVVYFWTATSCNIIYNVTWCNIIYNVTRCRSPAHSLLHYGDFLIVQMNVQRSPIWQIFFTSSNWANNTVKVTNNIFWVKDEGAVNHCTINRWFKKFRSGCIKLDDQAWSGKTKNMNSKAVR